MENIISKIALVVIGAVMVLIGIGTFISPANLPLASGIGVILYGIGAILNWREKRKVGFAKKTSLASAIITIFVGIGILASKDTEIVAVNLIVFILALWLIVTGVLEIIGAVIFIKAMTTADLGVQAPGATTSIILGAFLIVAGVVSIFRPLLAAITGGILISIILVLTGIRMIVSGFYSGILLREGAKS